MDMDLMALVSNVIKKEKVTNNILLTLKNNGHDVDKLSLEHNNSLYNLIKYYSTTGFNIELEEPHHLNLTTEHMIKFCLEDLKSYSEIITKNNTNLNQLIPQLIKVKRDMLETLIFIGASRQPSLTLSELASFNGRDGRPAYVAVNGTVYNVTNSIQWDSGTHFGLLAGKDLTEDFDGCHSMNMSILSSLPVVGTLKRGAEIEEETDMA
jgi:predicted heme/steroid binding protein